MQRESVNQKRGVSARNWIVWLAVLIAAPATLLVAWRFGNRKYYLSSLLLIGATVDYAILMTTRYWKERSKGREKKEAVRIALGSSISSVIVSALGFFAATFGVGLYSDIDMISSLCTLMSRGALISMFVVIFILPSMLMVFDKVIYKTTKKMKV